MAVEAAGRVAPRWYVVQVGGGREREMARRLTRLAPAGALEEPLFQPRYAAEAKSGGSWSPVERPQLRGYLVAVSRDPEALAWSVARSVDFARLLATDAGPAPLSREEAELLGGLGEPGSRVLPMSVATRGEGGLRVVEGPLVGREGMVEWVDRHKGVAGLRVEVAGRPVGARAGLAVLPEGAARARVVA